MNHKLKGDMYLYKDGWEVLWFVYNGFLSLAQEIIVYEHIYFPFIQEKASDITCNPEVILCSRFDIEISFNLAWNGIHTRLRWLCDKPVGLGFKHGWMRGTALACNNDPHLPSVTESHLRLCDEWFWWIGTKDAFEMTACYPASSPLPCPQPIMSILEFSFFLGFYVPADTKFKWVSFFLSLNIASRRREGIGRCFQ